MMINWTGLALRQIASKDATFEGEHDPPQTIDEEKDPLIDMMEVALDTLQERILDNCTTRDS